MNDLQIKIYDIILKQIFFEKRSQDAKKYSLIASSSAEEIFDLIKSKLINESNIEERFYYDVIPEITEIILHNINEDKGMFSDWRDVAWDSSYMIGIKILPDENFQFNP